MLPRRRKFDDGWNIPKPDAVISMKEPFQIPAQGEVQYQYIVMPTGFTEDKWIQAVEARPSDRSVVHHIVVFIRDPKSKWLRAAEPGIPYTPPGGGKDFTEHLRRRQRHPDDLYARHGARELAAGLGQVDQGRLGPGVPGSLHHQR